MFAEPCVFSKQSPPPLNCDPFLLLPRRHSHTYGHPLSRSYGANLPSSLAKVLSRALVYSTHLRVSVYGTGTQSSTLRGFSWKHGINHFMGQNCPSYSLLGVKKKRICLSLPPTSLNQVIHHPDDLPFFVTTSLQLSGTGILTCFPSTTPFGLALGPDLPWEDEPSPGNLRFTARWILTIFIATHASILTSQQSRPPYGNPSAR